MNPKDIYGDGHGFVAVSQGGPPSARPDNPPGIYVVCVFDLEGKRMTGHPCDGTYDSRRLALNAVVDACSVNARNVGHVEFCNDQKPRAYRFNYNLAEAPTVSTRILGLYKLNAPGTEQGWVYHTRVVWLAKPPEHGSRVADTHGLRYLTDERNDAPYFIQDPIAWALTPEP